MGANYQKKFEKDYQALWDKLNSITAENKVIINKVKDQQTLQDKVDDVLTENKILISKVDKLTGEIKILKADNTKLQGEVSRLKNQINKDSSNSGKPPSSNGFKKAVQSNRKKSTKKQGGQKGYEGS
ncbi:MAG: hypothetical protein COA82_01875 [Alkaliphilus sp.]|nr:MAG: hypothetical protein COA82_01875 [Alkaliphilus sp.]